MLKKDEIANPDSCLNKAADEEPVFVLRAKDAAAPNTIRCWAEERMERGLNIASDQKIVDALAIAERMEQWQAVKAMDLTSK